MDTLERKSYVLLLADFEFLQHLAREPMDAASLTRWGWLTSRSLFDRALIAPGSPLTVTTLGRAIARAPVRHIHELALVVTAAAPPK